MANKSIQTKPNVKSVDDFIAELDNEAKNTSLVLLKLMHEITREEPVIWGNGVIGFGKYHYKSKSGQEGDWFLTGFAPRKTNYSIYILQGFDAYPELMEKLGKFKTGKGCLYIKNLEVVNMDILEKLISNSFKHMKKINQ